MPRGDSSERACSPSPSDRCGSKPKIAMKREFVSILLAVGVALTETSTSSAQSALTGKVTNSATGQLLEGARVELQGLGRVVTTDNEGEYRIPDVAPGPVTLTVSYTGLDTAVVPVTVSAGTANRRDVG